MRLKRTPIVLAGAALVLGCAGAGAALWALNRAGILPRSLGPYLEGRSRGHNPAIEASGRWIAQWLMTQDRGRPDLMLPPTQLTPPPATAAAMAGKSDTRGNVVLVGSSEELLAAVALAEPGDSITLLPGTYAFVNKINAERPGRAGLPVTVRAIAPGNVLLQMNTTEGFKVSAPYWRFENLSIRGACDDDGYCEHAFHVVGGAHHFAAINNTILDFNAHFKINGSDKIFPDHGLIEGNIISNTHARLTRNPVTPIDLVAASYWHVRGNLISDFVKADGNRVSYGAFFKGGGSGNVFEQNTVLCEHRLRGNPGQSIGLSLGGGGTGKEFCRDSRCVTEQEQGVIRSNLIAACTDVGIYLNSAAGSIIAHNTMVDTNGIDVRFPETSASLEGNLIDGPIRSRDGGIVRETDNQTAPPFYAYLGYHPVRSLFRSPAQFDYAWKGGAGAAPRRAVAVLPAPPDLCAPTRPALPAYGAFEDFTSCVPARR
jgi:hypothetical protein